MTESPSDDMPTGDTASKTAEGSGRSQEQGRLESLLIDDTDDGALERLAEREIRVVDGPISSPPWRLLTLLLLALVAVGLLLLWVKQQAIPRADSQQLATVVEVRKVMPSRPAIPSPVTEQQGENVVGGGDGTAVAQAPAAGSQEDENIPLFSVVVGPFVNSESLEQAEAFLASLGLQGRRTTGVGSVPMVRLREGIYSAELSRQRLRALKLSVPSAFALPSGEKKAVYLGSFADRQRALDLKTRLAGQGIDVELVTAEVEMSGTQLVALQADRQTAEQMAAHIMEQGLKVKVIQAE